MRGYASQSIGATVVWGLALTCIAMHYTHMKPTPRDCPVCSRTFQPRKKWQRYCGLICRNEYHRNRLAKARELLDQMEKSDATGKSPVQTEA